VKYSTIAIDKGIKKMPIN
jgi:hypothetical protein